MCADYVDSLHFDLLSIEYFNFDHKTDLNKRYSFDLNWSFSLGINSVKRLTSFDGRAPAIKTNPAAEKAIKQNDERVTTQVTVSRKC